MSKISKSDSSCTKSASEAGKSLLSSLSCKSSIDQNRKSYVDIKLKKLAQLGKVRNIHLGDKDALKVLVTESSKRLFGNFDLLALLNKSYVSIGLDNVNGDLIAAIFLNNYPNVPSIPPWDWIPWIRKLYVLTDVTTRNTLFVHLTLFNLDYVRQFLRPLLKGVFELDRRVIYIFFVVPPNAKFTEWIENESTIITPMGFLPKQAQSLHLFARQNYVDIYKMRMAVIEDNDDIVLLIDAHSKRLQNTYGEFYIAEMILNDTGRKVIVAELNGTIVAVMCFNEDVNHALLNEQFQLECYYGLRKQDIDDEIVKPLKTISTIDDYIEGVSALSASCSSIWKKPSEVYEKEESNISGDSSDLNYLVQELEIPNEVVDEEDDEFKFSNTNEEMRYAGFADSKFSANQLKFTEEELDVWRRLYCRRASDFDIVTKPSVYFGKVPKYLGGSNCFTLELAAAWPIHELALYELLETSFELYPDKDYCVLCTPSTAPAFDLQSNVFVRVPPRPSSTFPHELYVAHRCAILSEIYVRRADMRDVRQVTKLLKTCLTGDGVMDRFDEALSDIFNMAHEAYVVKCEYKVVGLCVVKEYYDMTYIETHYQLAAYIDLQVHKPGCIGEIQEMVLSPIFQRHSRFILLELHRLSNYSLLLYKVTPGQINTKMMIPTACILGNLVPLMPSNMPQYSKGDDDNWVIPEALQRVTLPFATYISTVFFCGIPRIEINHKIVVVGASTSGLAFLVNLAYQKNPNYRITFNNITLVSTHGIQPYKSNIYRDTIIPDSSEIDGHYLSLISLKTYINEIKGVMTGIDRPMKYITVNKGRLPYDLLFLTCGHQYQLPVRNVPKRYMHEHPDNVFVVNTEDDVDGAVKKLHNARRKGVPGNVIIYGNTIQIYCTVQAVICMGFDTDDIVLVFHQDDIDKDPDCTIFNDADIEEGVKKLLEDQNIELYKGCKFIDWKFDKKIYNVTQITFESRYRIHEIPCLAAFMFSEKKISLNTFLAINKANLIYDGGLVIDPNFRTNDPNIYAAGSMTKYPRRYYADHMKHEYFNQTEVGTRMANVIAEKLFSDIFYREKPSFFERCTSMDKMLVPRYHKPLKLVANLPGAYYYIIKKPGAPSPYYLDDTGQTLTTGNPLQLNTNTNVGYFKLHINQYGIVETMTCLSQNQVESSNYIHLWGKHEKLLNNLVKRFAMGLVPDLFKFFSEPKMCALYHDRFNKLNDEIMNMMTSLTDQPGNSLIEDVVRLMRENNWRALNKDQIRTLKEKFLGSDYEALIKMKLLDFLQENSTYLPMYATPTVRNMLLGAYTDSPLFRKM